MGCCSKLQLLEKRKLRPKQERFRYSTVTSRQKPILSSQTLRHMSPKSYRGRNWKIGSCGKPDYISVNVQLPDISANCLNIRNRNILVILEHPCPACWSVSVTVVFTSPQTRTTPLFFTSLVIIIHILPITSSIITFSKSWWFIKYKA